MIAAPVRHTLCALDSRRASMTTVMNHSRSERRTSGRIYQYILIHIVLRRRHFYMQWPGHPWWGRQNEQLYSYTHKTSTTSYTSRDVGYQKEYHYGALGCIHAPNPPHQDASTHLLIPLGVLKTSLLDVANAGNNNPLVVVVLATSLVSTLGLSRV